MLRYSVDTRNVLPFDAYSPIISDNELTVTPNLNYFGDITINVSVQDSDLLEDDTSFILTVNPKSFTLSFPLIKSFSKIYL